MIQLAVIVLIWNFFIRFVDDKWKDRKKERKKKKSENAGSLFRLAMYFMKWNLLHETRYSILLIWAPALHMNGLVVLFIPRSPHPQPKPQPNRFTLYIHTYIAYKFLTTLSHRSLTSIFSSAFWKKKKKNHLPSPLLRLYRWLNAATWLQVKISSSPHITPERHELECGNVCWPIRTLGDIWWSFACECVGSAHRCLWTRKLAIYVSVIMNDKYALRSATGQAMSFVYGIHENLWCFTGICVGA